MAIIIREEHSADVTTIFELTKAAFEHHPYGDHSEQYVINGLRAANALTLSLVAEANSQIVGHAAFSPVTISDGTSGWYGLGPISVAPACQKQGIGSTLIRTGLARLQSLGAKGCVLLGDAAYYQRFGFANNPHLSLADVPQHYFLGLAFADDMAHGNVLFHEAFAAKSRFTNHRFTNH